MYLHSQPLVGVDHRCFFHPCAIGGWQLGALHLGPGGLEIGFFLGKRWEYPLEAGGLEGKYPTIRMKFDESSVQSGQKTKKLKMLFVFSCVLVPFFFPVLGKRHVLNTNSEKLGIGITFIICTTVYIYICIFFFRYFEALYMYLYLCMCISMHMYMYMFPGI